MAEAQGGLIQAPIAFSPPTGGHPTGKQQRASRGSEFTGSIMSSRGAKTTGTEAAGASKIAEVAEAAL